MTVNNQIKTNIQVYDPVNLATQQIFSGEKVHQSSHRIRTQPTNSILFVVFAYTFYHRKA